MSSIEKKKTLEMSIKLFNSTLYFAFPENIMHLIAISTVLLNYTLQQFALHWIVIVTNMQCTFLLLHVLM